jgi:mono/diheme cytochrome c family protein
MRWLAFPLLVLLAVFALIWLFAGQDDSPGRTSLFEVTDVAEGKTLYATNCAVCHGANLEGQENWRTPGEDGRLLAPPHDESGHTWHHGDKLLFDYTKLGGKALMAQQGVEFDSGMPGFGDQLTDAEIRNVLAYIKSTWPERVQAVQAERSAAETQ